jgi:hypothetical protein
MVEHTFVDIVSPMDETTTKANIPLVKHIKNLEVVYIL